MPTETENSVGPEVARVSKAIQSAVWRMNLLDFCETLGWTNDSYAKDKFREFQALGQSLGQFDTGTLSKLVEADK